MKDIELYNDHFQNYKVYGIPKAQLIIADVPYNLGNSAYASNPSWYVDGEIERVNSITGVSSVSKEPRQTNLFTD